MMGWETPLMERHAAIICAAGSDVLNVGFGMGIVDTFIQQHQVRCRSGALRCARRSTQVGCAGLLATAPRRAEPALHCPAPCAPAAAQPHHH